ncbi:hypothetical protein ASF55_21205 [Methylobacterium sp. Leaf119]|nr:hypothetical protein ASF55_21205 [Methylobacterium sp. Leaf119]
MSAWHGPVWRAMIGALRLDRRHAHEGVDWLGQRDDLSSVGMVQPLEPANVVLLPPSQHG